MNLLEMRTELAARGFNHIETATLDSYINDARQQVDNAFLWPYREKSITGIAPLYVSDLGVVEAVTNETLDYQLRSGDYRSLLDDYGDLSLTGPPEVFYVGTPGGSPIVATYPTDSSTIGVQYYRRAPDLVDDADEPACPSDYHYLILDKATQLGYMRTDNIAAAAQLQPFIDNRMQSMIDALLGGQQIAGPMGHTMVRESTDG